MSSKTDKEKSTKCTNIRNKTGAITKNEKIPKNCKENL